VQRGDASIEPLGLGARIRIVATFVALTTTVAVAYEAYAGQAEGVALLAVFGFYVATAGMIIAFATWTAATLGMRSFLWLEPLTGAERLRRMAIWGVGIGVVLSVGNVLLSGGVDPALRPWFWQRIQTPAGTALFAARAAVLEESFFRLFMIPFLVSLAMRTRRPRYRMTLREGRASVRHERPDRPGWAEPAAVLVSSLLFGLAHPANPVAAIVLAPLLSLAFLRGGWESAAIAHFLANWLVFTLLF